jgi:hypothetical protein
MRVPSWAERGRTGWSNTGSVCPSFAKTPGPDQESVWDYPRPPRIIEDGRLVELKVGQVVVARTNNAVRVLETASPPTFYPPDQEHPRGDDVEDAVDDLEGLVVVDRPARPRLVDLELGDERRELRPEASFQVDEMTGRRGPSQPGEVTIRNVAACIRQALEEVRLRHPHRDLLRQRRVSTPGPSAAGRSGFCGWPPLRQEQHACGDQEQARQHPAGRR